MATTVKDSAQVKQKSVSSSSSSPSSHKIDSRHGKKTHKSPFSGASLDSSVNSSLFEKPIPHYLKPTISSSHDICKYGKKQVIEDVAAKLLIRRRLFDKLPSASQLPRTPSYKEITHTPSSHSRKLASPKSISERKSIIPINGKVKSFKKSKSLKMRPSNAKTSSTTTITTITPSSLDIKENLDIKSEKEEKDLPKVIEQGKEHNVVEVHPLQDQVPLNASTLCEATKISENNESEDSFMNNKETEACNALPTIEELDVAFGEEGEEDMKGQKEEGEGHKDDKHNGNNEEEGDINDVTSEKYEGILSSESNEEEVLPEKIQICKEKADSTKRNKDRKTRKLKFRRHKEVGKDVDGEGVGQRRLNFEERGEIEVAGHEKAESENVLLKHQGVIQGKKEALAFNDVIEETASKLVEERKSKVKALVGAFETVMSLQEPESHYQNQNPSPSPNEQGKRMTI